MTFDARIRLHLKGASPLLMNPMGDDALEGLRTGVSKPKRRDITREQEASEKLYPDPESRERYGLPQENIFACLREAGRGFNLKPRVFISTAKGTILPSLLVVEETFLAFPEGTKWRVDARRGVNHNCVPPAPVCAIRPRFDEWSFPVTIAYDAKQMSEETLLKLVERAGSAVGLCDFRPACKGPFGRFAVAKAERLTKPAEKTEEKRVTKRAAVLAGATAGAIAIIFGLVSLAGFGI